MDFLDILQQVAQEHRTGYVNANTNSSVVSNKERFMTIMNHAAEIGKLTKRIEALETSQKLLDDIMSRNEDNSDLCDRAATEWLKLERSRLKLVYERSYREMRAAQLQLEQMDIDEAEE